jgi:hypothetical protein
MSFEIKENGFYGTMVKNGGTFIMATVNASQKSVETTPIVKNEDESVKYLRWYNEDNAFPDKIKKRLEDDPELFPFIEKFCNLLYAGGLVYGTWKYDARTKKKYFEPIFDAEIEQWLKDSNISAYMREVFIDTKTFYNGFAEMVYDANGKNDGGKIVALSVQDATFCRFGKQNSKGLKDKVFVNADWEDDAEAKNAKEYACLNPYFKPYDQLENIKGNVVYYPITLPGTPGRIAYQRPAWYGLVDGKALETARLMMEYKYYYMKNGMSIKYHVEVDEEYFIAKYKDWPKKTDAERVKIVQDEIRAFNDVYHKVDAAGKTHLTMMKRDNMKNQYSTWKITQMKNETPSGEFVNDMNQISLLKLRAIGLNQSLVGGINSSNGSIGAGSGSNARIALNAHAIENKGFIEACLAPLNSVITKVNGWEKKYPGITFMTEQYFIATLDQVNPENRM